MTAPAPSAVETGQATGAPALEAMGLGRDYGTTTAVAAVDLEVRAGEFFGFLGPNGAGKTTTIHMLATLLRPHRGRARVLGYDVVESPLALRRWIGLVFQETTLDLDLTAEDNLRFAARLYGLAGTELEQRLDEVFELFALVARRHDRVRAFSGGMRRALDLARGVLHRPRLLFLDEPTVGLDPTTRRRVWRFLDRLRMEEGTTLFLTTHNLAEAEGCDRVAIIDGGRIIARGAPDELKRQVGQERIELEVDEPEHDLVAEIHRLTGLEPQQRPLGLTLPTDSPEEVLPKLLPLVGNGIRTVSVRRASLEDVFVHLTGRTSDRSDA